MGGEPTPDPPEPRLGNFADVFRVFRVQFTPIPDDEREASAARRAALPPPHREPRPRTGRGRINNDLVEEATSLSARCSKATPILPPDKIGFLSGIKLAMVQKRYKAPDSVLHEAAEDTLSSDSEPDEEPDTDAGTYTTDTRRAASLDVAIASASTSPATVAASTATISTPKRGDHLKAAKFTKTTGTGMPGTPRTPRTREVQRTPLSSAKLLRASAAFSSVHKSVQAGGHTPILAKTTPYAYYRVGNALQPSYQHTKEQKLSLIDTKLDAEKQKYGATYTPWDAPQTPAVHVFVDLSNIVIGFINHMRVELSIEMNEKLVEPPFFFEGLARILERGRAVERRVTAGSVSINYSNSNDDCDRGRWRPYMLEADRLGYEMNILSRVIKSASPVRKPLWKAHARSASSGDERRPPPPRAAGRTSPSKKVLKNGEQGVDEILQLKMCHSVMDNAPGTLVLATGDGAAAEFSDGFLKHVERALERDWCVELVAWKQGISAEWLRLVRKREGKAKDTVRGQFRIIELDAFVHELFGPADKAAAAAASPVRPNWRY